MIQSLDDRWIIVIRLIHPFADGRALQPLGAMSGLIQLARQLVCPSLLDLACVRFMSRLMRWRVVMSYEVGALSAMALGIVLGAALTAYAIWSKKQEDRDNSN